MDESVTIEQMACKSDARSLLEGFNSNSRFSHPIRLWCVKNDQKIEAKEGAN
jgi:hypothetical protein